MFNANLTNCDTEPIHIPGKIQDYGFLVLLDENYTIVCCSENVSSFIGVTPGALLNQPLETLEACFKLEPPGFLFAIMALAGAQDKVKAGNPYYLKINGAGLNLLTSKVDGRYLLAFEPDNAGLETDIQHLLGTALSDLLSKSDLQHLLYSAAEQVKKLIGYDRVMVYKFHEDGHGEVIAEAKMAHLEAWLGLHYPASDIPVQARALYKINLSRQIADVNSTPAALLSTPTAGAELVVDLTDVALRAVSPVHIQYLKNMGVASSFSISLLYHGELWGLIACHNYSPKFISYQVRDSAKLVGQVLSSALSYRQLEEDQHKNNRFKVAVDALGVGLLKSDDIHHALFNQKDTVLDAVDSCGVVLYYDHKLTALGNTPDKVFVLELMSWLADHMKSNLYETNKLPDLPFAINYKNCASGILACVLSRTLREFIIWFRPEIISTVNWAGNPDLEAKKGEDQILRISPRTSFASWSKETRHQSIPWKMEDLKSARQVREEVVSAIGRKANEMRLLNRKLKQAYAELDSFSYTLSHDLKTPLTAIKIYSQLLRSNKSIDPAGQQMVEHIFQSVEKMRDMTRDVLDYSRTGQQNIRHTLVDMEVLLQEIKQELLVVNEHPKLQIRIGKMPISLFGDRTMIMQLFSNLLGNAVKYSGQSDEPLIDISCLDNGNSIQYSVKDNGIGIKASEHRKIFDLFSRSDEVKNYEGSGVGLSIAKKIIAKHHGKIWVESNERSGSIFHVAFKKQANTAH